MAAEEGAALRVQLHSLTQRLAALRLRQSRELQTVKTDLEASLHEMALESSSATRAAEDRLRSALRTYESESSASAALLSQLLALRAQNGAEVRNLQREIRLDREEADFLRLHASEKLQNDRNRLRIQVQTLRNAKEQAYSTLISQQLAEEHDFTSLLQASTAHTEQLDRQTSALRSELSLTVLRGSQEVTSLSETLQSLQKLVHRQEGEGTQLAKLQSASLRNAHTLSRMVLKVGQKAELLKGENHLLRSKSARLGKLVYGKGRLIRE